MKNYALLIILFGTFHLAAQDLNVFTKVTKDSVLVKWLPNNFDQLIKVSKGAKVTRIESSQTSNFSSLDFSSGTTTTISGAEARYNQLDESDAQSERFKALLDPVIEEEQDAEVTNFAFGTAVIENVVTPEFQYILGNIHTDKTFSKSKKYVYKIEVKGINPVYVSVDASKRTTYPSVDDLKLSLDKKKTVDISWNSQKIKRESFAFDIEHSIDKEKEGEYLTDIPFLPFQSDQEIKDKNASFRHESPEQGHFHYYRIQGRDQFGFKSMLSEWKKIYVPRLVHAWVEIDSVQANGPERIVVANIHPLKNNPNIDEIGLMRSTDMDSGYVQVGSLKYTDTVAFFTLTGKESGDSYYYKAFATSKDDTVSSVPFYFFTLDQEPPGIATGLNGTIDSSGIVNIQWTAPLDDDIKGYKVYRGNATNEEFVEKTKELSPETTFTDTLALDNLTPEVYYIIRAVDNNYNQSELSDTLLLLKPDTIAPMTAVLQSIKMDKPGMAILLSWHNSDSDDVKQSTLIRTSGIFVDTISRWSDNTSSYVDTALTAGNNYSYHILIEDKSGNQTESKPLVQYFEPGYRKPLKNVAANVNRETQRIQLSWDAPKESVFSYQIYRSKYGEKLLPLKTIKNGETSFEDRSLELNTKYTYSVKYVTSEGIHGKPVKVDIVY